MILLGERIIYEVQARWNFAEEVLAKHQRGESIPFEEWVTYIDYVKEKDERAVYVSPKWGNARECAMWAFSAQLEKLGKTGHVTMIEARAHFLIRCGERLKLAHKEETCYALAKDKEEWNKHIGKIKLSRQAYQHIINQT